MRSYVFLGLGITHKSAFGKTSVALKAKEGDAEVPPKVKDSKLKSPALNNKSVTIDGTLVKESELEKSWYQRRCTNPPAMATLCFLITLKWV